MHISPPEATNQSNIRILPKEGLASLAHQVMLTNAISVTTEGGISWHDPGEKSVPKRPCDVTPAATIPPVKTGKGICLLTLEI